MQLRLQRNKSSNTTTTGTLTIEGAFECYTLEDVVRNIGPNGEGKIPGETAIPAGNYQIIINMSQRFGKTMMRILNVPHFDGILIHGGNTAANTHGCILVGKSLSGDKIPAGSSTPALTALRSKVEAALAKKEIVKICILDA